MKVDPAVMMVHLHLVGLVMAGLVVVNLVVPYWFRWREEMPQLSLINRQIVQAHTLFLVLLLGMFSILLLTCSDALLDHSRLSRTVLAGLTIFWALRMAMQWWFYSPAIWRGHRFHTAMHWVFSATWIYVTAVFGLALLQSLGPAA